jgi:hypothetical protein
MRRRGATVSCASIDTPPRERTLALPFPACKTLAARGTSLRASGGEMFLPSQVCRGSIPALCANAVEGMAGLIALSVAHS